MKWQKLLVCGKTFCVKTYPV